MQQNIRIIKPEAYIKATGDIDSGEKSAGYIDSNAFELRSYETKPLPGFEFPKGFPNCCEYHSGLIDIGTKAFDDFPNCCSDHRKLNGAYWFKKSDYAYLPLKLATSITYTIHCIESSIGEDSWFKDISDYIEYTKTSYGQLPAEHGAPVGLNLYLYNLELRVKSLEGIDEEKRKKLVDFIQSYSVPEIPESAATDLNILMDTYKQWIKDFPFELSFFSHLKSHFEKTLPIVKEACGTNQYTGLTAFKLLSKDELLGLLVDMTNTILQEINVLKLYESGTLNDATKIQLELLVSERRHKLNRGYKNASPDKDTQYRRILKEWLADEKKFLKQLKPLLNEQRTVENQYKGDLLDRLVMVAYFKSKSVEVQLFAVGNDNWIAAAQADLVDMRDAEKKGEIKLPHRTNDLNLERLFEAEVSEFDLLLRDKFSEAKAFKGFKTIARFVKFEVNEIHSRYRKQYEAIPILQQWYEYLNNWAENGIEDTEQHITKRQELLGKLLSYDFNKLTLVMALSQSQQDSLIDLLTENPLPYKIAMLAKVGFLTYAQQNYCPTKQQLYKLLAQLLGASERVMKGNVLVLQPKTSEDKTRYTAHKYTKQVATDYQN